MKLIEFIDLLEEVEVEIDPKDLKNNALFILINDGENIKVDGVFALETLAATIACLCRHNSDMYIAFKSALRLFEAIEKDAEIIK